MHDAYILTFFTWLLRCFVNDIVINLTRNHRLRNHDDRMITSGQKGNVRIAKKNLHVKNEPTYKVLFKIIIIEMLQFINCTLLLQKSILKSWNYSDDSIMLRL